MCAYLATDVPAPARAPVATMSGDHGVARSPGAAPNRPDAGARPGFPLAALGRRCLIYPAAPSPTQGGRRGRHGWRLRFEPVGRRQLDPLTGRTGSDDPLSTMQLSFPDRESAVAYARRQGLRWTVTEPPKRRGRGRAVQPNGGHDD